MQYFTVDNLLLLRSEYRDQIKICLKSWDVEDFVVCRPYFRPNQYMVIGLCPS